MSAPSQPEVEATMQQLRELNEQVLEASRHADSVYLDAYEKTLRAFVDFQRAAADATDDALMKKLAKAQADFTNDVTTAYVSAARALRR